MISFTHHVFYFPYDPYVLEPVSPPSSGQLQLFSFAKKHKVHPDGDFALEISLFRHLYRMTGFEAPSISTIKKPLHRDILGAGNGFIGQKRRLWKIPRGIGSFLGIAEQN